MTTRPSPLRRRGRSVGALVAASLSASLLVGCVPRSGPEPGAVELTTSGDIIDAIDAECAAHAEGGRGDLRDAIPGEWERITVGVYGAEYDEIARQSGVRFERHLAGSQTTGGIVVVVRDGQLGEAYMSERLPVQVQRDGTVASGREGVVTVEWPGAFTARGASCEFAAS
ncbi:hypothetical protein USB125703_00297 [Pseudoclavibacter triregionum]|nr:hypothetical protein USB125703_00297 [Pseudoclavibacter triregionum]